MVRGILASIALLAAASAGAFEIERGDWQQGGVLRGQVAPGSELRVGDRRVPVSPEGQFVLGLDRDAPERVTLTLAPPEGQARELNVEVAPREYEIQRIEGVPQSTVTPSEEQVRRARKEAALAREARERELARTDFTQTFQWPLVGPITGVYGSQRFYNGEPRSPHYGIDIAAPEGTPVQAPAAGEVTLVHEDMFFSGGTLILDHGQGLSSTFIHLSRILVEEGETVGQGQAIAEVGATGRATGAHLDWRMNWFDRRVDPATLVEPMPEP